MHQLGARERLANHEDDGSVAVPNDQLGSLTTILLSSNGLPLQQKGIGMNTEPTKPTPEQMRIREKLAHLSPESRIKALDWLVKNVEEHNTRTMQERAKAPKG